MVNELNDGSNVIDSRDWRLYAACKGMDTSMFIDGRSKEAKAVCKTCRVTKACLNYAIEKSQWGVWGGKSNYERRQHHGVTDIEEIDIVSWSTAD